MGTNGKEREEIPRDRGAVGRSRPTLALLALPDPSADSALDITPGFVRGFPACRAACVRYATAVSRRGGACALGRWTPGRSAQSRAVRGRPRPRARGPWSSWYRRTSGERDHAANGSMACGAKPMLETRALVPSPLVDPSVPVYTYVESCGSDSDSRPAARARGATVHRAPIAPVRATTKIANPSARFTGVRHNRSTAQGHCAVPSFQKAQASSSGTPACLSPRQPPSTVETIRRGRIVCTQSRSSSKDECSE